MSLIRRGGGLEESLHSRTKQRDGRSFQRETGRNQAGSQTQLRKILSVGGKEAGEEEKRRESMSGVGCTILPWAEPEHTSALTPSIFNLTPLTGREGWQTLPARLSSGLTAQAHRRKEDNFRKRGSKKGKSILRVLLSSRCYKFQNIEGIIDQSGRNITPFLCW